MNKPRKTVISSAELPMCMVRRLSAGVVARPRVEVVFDPHSRLILGFRFIEDASVD